MLLWLTRETMKNHKTLRFYTKRRLRDRSKHIFTQNEYFVILFNFFPSFLYYFFKNFKRRVFDIYKERWFHARRCSFVSNLLFLFSRSQASLLFSPLLSSLSSSVSLKHLENSPRKNISGSCLRRKHWLGKLLPQTTNLKQKKWTFTSEVVRKKKQKE